MTWYAKLIVKKGNRECSPREEMGNREILKLKSRFLFFKLDKS